MPWGLTRFHHSGQSHFVTFCCYHCHSTPSLRSVAQGRLRLFTADASRRMFESALERVRRSFRLQVYGYVVMPEHVHLLLSEPQRDASSDRTPPTQAKTGLEWPPASGRDECRGPSTPQNDSLRESFCYAQDDNSEFVLYAPFGSRVSIGRARTPALHRLTVKQTKGQLLIIC
jgi:putative transposase